MTRTVAASVPALPDAYLPKTGRRRFLAALASLPIVGAAGAALLTSKADAAAATIVQMVDAAQERCLATERAFADALATYEASLPRMHPDLNYSGRNHHVHVPMERGFGGRHVNRGDLSSTGSRFPRYVVTSAYCRELIQRYPSGPFGHRYIGRLLRRAEKYEAALAQLEDRLALRELDADRHGAQADLEKLGDAIFSYPGRTRAAIYAQARVICALQAVGTREHSAWLVQRWGVTLAKSVCDLGRAA